MLNKLCMIIKHLGRKLNETMESKISVKFVVGPFD